MAFIRNKLFIPVMTITFLFVLFYHRAVFQDSLRHVIGSCFQSDAKNNINIHHEEEKVEKPKAYDLQADIDAIFNNIQKDIPHVKMTDFNRSTSGANSKVYIINKKDQYCVGEDLVVQLDAYDHLGNRKTHGGDFIRPRLYSLQHGAAVSGRVEDFHNGFYYIHFPLRWVDSGSSIISIRLWHPSEAIAALWRARHASPGLIAFEGRYEYLGKEALSTCGFLLNTAEEVCEYRDEYYEEVFYCVRPKNFTCECLNDMRAVDPQKSYLTPEEKALLERSNVGVEMAHGLGNIVVTNCENKSPAPKPECQTGMSSPFPSGYFYNKTWHPMYCKMRVYETGGDYIKCLQGKDLFLIGDSTLRQYMLHFTETIKIAQFFRYREGGWNSWEKTLEALNMEKDMYISYKRHGFPLERFTFYYFKEDMYTSRQIDQRAGGRNTIIVITLGQHFRQFPLKLFIRRAINIRRAVQRLFLRSPDTKVIIKTENTREGVTSFQERIGDFHGYTQYLVLREVFQGINVGFVDAWDMTVAAATETVHPPGYTFESIMSMTFTFAC